MTRLILGGDVPQKIRPPLGLLLLQRATAQHRPAGDRSRCSPSDCGFSSMPGSAARSAPIRVPISYRALPAGLVIVNQRPDSVQIQVPGPRTLLSLLDPERMVLRLDFTGVTIGQASFKIGPEMFNVPRQTDVTQHLAQPNRARHRPHHRPPGAGSCERPGPTRGRLSRRVGKSQPARCDRAWPQPFRFSHR